VYQSRDRVYHLYGEVQAQPDGVFMSLLVALEMVFGRPVLPKQAARKAASNLEAQSEIYMRERNRAMKLKRQREEIALAVAREELIEKSPPSASCLIV
jgi:hypothetical protein